MQLESKQKTFGKILGILPGLHTLPPSLARLLYLGLDRMVGLPKIQMAKVQRHTVPSASSNNPDIELRAYYPSISKPLKTLVYFHGGGCVIGNLATHDRFCRYLADKANVTVIAVDYRLAPKHKYPAAIIDAIEAWNWINDHAKQLEIDPDNIGTAGDSAGGYLSCLIGLTSLHKQLPVQNRHKVKYQALLYPMADLSAEGDSYLEHTENLILTRDLMVYFRDHYLNNHNEITEPLASPLLADCLAESPKTYLLTLEFDPLRDEGKQLAQCLQELEIPIHHQHFDDCMHSFISVTRISARAKQATDEMCQSIHQLVHNQ